MVTKAHPTMQAIRVTEYGSPDVLRLTELDVPRPGPGEIAIDVHYAGVNFAEVMFRRGQFEIGVPHVPGMEVAGTVSALGDGVTGLEVGTTIAALTLAGGGYAETVVTRADWSVRLDDPAVSPSPPLAAAFPCNVLTARGVLDLSARLRSGETVLVTAPAGGVGTAAVQVARRMGAAAVYGVTGSPEKAAYAREFGYEEVFGYEDLAEDLAEITGGRGVDVLLDSVGGPLRRAGFGLLAPFGRHVIFGNAADDDAEFTGTTIWSESRSLTGFNLGALAHQRPDLVRGSLAEAAAEVASGALRIDVTELPLAEAAKAHEIIESRGATGKYVLRVGPR